MDVGQCWTGQRRRLTEDFSGLWGEEACGVEHDEQFEFKRLTPSLAKVEQVA